MRVRARVGGGRVWRGKNGVVKIRRRCGRKVVEEASVLERNQHSFDPGVSGVVFLLAEATSPLTVAN